MSRIVGILAVSTETRRWWPRLGGAKIDSCQGNGTSVTNGARWKWMTSLGSAPVAQADVFHGTLLFANLRPRRLCPISMCRLPPPGIACAHITTASLDGASTSQ